MEYKLTLTLTEIQSIGAALMESPTKIGMPLLEKLEKQVKEQINAQNTKEVVSEYQAVPEDVA